MVHSLLLTAHIICGLVGTVTGTAAFVFRKGGSRHRAAGNVFTAAMLGVGLSAAVLAYGKHQTSNVFGGCLTCYLIATGWLAGRAARPYARVLTGVGLATALLIGSLEMRYGWLAAHSPDGLKDGYGMGIYVFFGGVVLLAALGDVRLLLFGMRLVSQVSRHLWRMCFGLFIATGSFFLGQQQVFPELLRGSPVLAVLAIAPLPLMLFWLIRVRFSAFRARPRTEPAPSIGLPHLPVEENS